MSNSAKGVALAGLTLLFSTFALFGAGEVNDIRGKTHVAACPPMKASVPRFLSCGHSLERGGDRRVDGAFAADLSVFH